MYELVRVGADNLIGEIIRLEGDNATIQVWKKLHSDQTGRSLRAHAAWMASLFSCLPMP
jgi:vacuolar-type H+-ATPase catalytic subunit A/Vma1